MVLAGTLASVQYVGVAAVRGAAAVVHTAVVVDRELAVAVAVAVAVVQVLTFDAVHLQAGVDGHVPLAAGAVHAQTDIPVRAMALAAAGYGAWS